MKRFVLILLLVTSGCAHQEALSDDQTKASSQLQRWVPVGTPAAAAQRIMKQHEFTIDENDTNAFYCTYEGTASFSDPVETIGKASFILKDGKVSAEQIKIYFKGP